MNEHHHSDIQCLRHSPDSLQKLRPRFGPGPIASVPWNQTGGQYSTSLGLRRVSSSPTAALAREYAVVFTCGQSHPPALSLSPATVTCQHSHLLTAPANNTCNAYYHTLVVRERVSLVSEEDSGKSHQEVRWR
jgi:hypothetical protein